MSTLKYLGYIQSLYLIPYSFLYTSSGKLDIKKGYDPVDSREGHLLIISFSENEFGLGDISPLKYYSTDFSQNILDIKNQIQLLYTSKVKDLLPIIKAFSPSIYHGVLSALTHMFYSDSVTRDLKTDLEIVLKNSSLIKALALKSLSGGLPTNLLTSITTSKLIDCSLKEAKLTDRIDANIKTIKIKVTPEPSFDRYEYFDTLVKILNELCEQRLIKLRLDCNESWTIDELKQFLENINIETRKSIEYIEDPIEVIHPHDYKNKILNNLLIKYNIGRAYDNEARIIDIGDEESYYTNLKKYHIIKPMVSRNVISINKNIILSSSYESHIGLAHLNILAGMTDDNTRAHGIATVDILPTKMSVILGNDVYNLDLPKNVNNYISSPQIAVEFLDELVFILLSYKSLERSKIQTTTDNHKIEL